MDAGLRRDARSWEDLGRLDPLWAVVTHEDRRFGGWDQPAFDATGARDVAEVFAYLRDQLGLEPGRARALDFGCGAGRLTRALAERFDAVVGVDLSSSMLAAAREMTPAAMAQVSYVQNTRPDLGLFADGAFDFALSLITLQHVSDPDVVGRLVSELVRVLRPGGVAVFQVPDRAPRNRRLRVRQALYDLGRAVGLPSSLLYERLNLWSMSVTALPEADVRRRVADAGGVVRAVVSDRRTGSDAAADRSYCVTKPAD